jgi:DNA-binding response OmpR family regulator
MKVLVVDNDKDCLEIIRYILSEEGFEVTTSSAAASPGVARRYDLILLDERAGTERGPAVCQRLKADPHTAAIPVILMSVLNDGELHATRSGADGFLAKPFDIDHLSALVNKLRPSTR